MPPAQKPPKQAKRPLATPKEVADFLGGEITEDTLKDWRYKGTGPLFMPVGRHVRYDWDDVEAWLRDRRTTHATAAQGAA